MLAACSSTDCAWRTTSSPSGVTVTSLALRSNSLTSSSSSSFLTATDSVGCETKQASAALPKCRSRATATMYLSSVNVMGLLSYLSGVRVKDRPPWPARTPPLRQALSILRNSVFVPNQRATWRRAKRGMAVQQHWRGELPGPVQQFRVGRQVGKAQQRAPDWRAPRNSPGPRISRSRRAISNPSCVSPWPQPLAGRFAQARCVARGSTATRRPTRPHPAPHGRAAGAAATARSVRHARSPSARRWAHRRPPRSPWC
jgi:hypothetical protein